MQVDNVQHHITKGSLQPFFRLCSYHLPFYGRKTLLSSQVIGQRLVVFLRFWEGALFTAKYVWWWGFIEGLSRMAYGSTCLSSEKLSFQVTLYGAPGTISIISPCSIKTASCRAWTPLRGEEASVSKGLGWSYWELDGRSSLCQSLRCKCLTVCYELIISTFWVNKENYLGSLLARATDIA